MDGAYFRVHHFAQQLASPFPLLAAVGAKTRKIEIGTAVIDMRYENPRYMAEDAGARISSLADACSWELVAVLPTGHRWLALFWLPPDSRRKMRHRPGDTPKNFSSCCAGRALRGRTRARCFPIRQGLSVWSRLRRVARSDLVGICFECDSCLGRETGNEPADLNPQFDETGEPLHIQQAAQIRAYRAAWKEAGHTRTPRISVSRSIFALLDDRDRAYFGRGSEDQSVSLTKAHGRFSAAAMLLSRMF